MINLSEWPINLLTKVTDFYGSIHFSTAMSVSPNMKRMNCHAYVSCKYLINVFLACAFAKVWIIGSVYISVSLHVCAFLRAWAIFV